MNDTPLVIRGAHLNTIIDIFKKKYNWNDSSKFNFERLEFKKIKSNRGFQNIRFVSNKGWFNGGFTNVMEI